MKINEKKLKKKLDEYLRNHNPEKVHHDEIMALLDKALVDSEKEKAKQRRKGTPR
jgi:hypothetical protein